MIELIFGPFCIVTGIGTATDDVTLRRRRPDDPLIVPMNNPGVATENWIRKCYIY